MTRTHAPNGHPYGTYEMPEVHDQLWAGWHGDMAWDIGANEGQSVDRMVDYFRKVYAFEPGDEAFVMLAQCWGWHAAVHLRHQAVGDHDGTMELSVAPHAIEGGQLLDPGMFGNPGVENPWFSNEVSRRTVPCTSMDALAAELGVPDFVKIDTEGGEARVLEGGRRVLAEGHTDFLIEFHSPDLRRYCMTALTGYGYTGIEWVREPGAVMTGKDPEGDWGGWLRARHPR